MATALLSAAAHAEDCRARIDSSLAGFSSDLPIFALETCGAALANRPPIAAGWALFTTGSDRRASLSQAPAAEGGLSARYIGHSSLGLPKRHVAIALDQPRALLELPAATRWVLHGPMADKTLVRNALAYGWAREMGLPAPRTRFVELFANEDGGAVSRADLRGVYLLMEWLEPGPGRLPISEGGFLFRRDQVGSGDSTVVTEHGERFAVDWPNPASPAQLEALRRRLNAVEAALYGNAPAAELASSVDLASFVNEILLVEVTKNADGFKSSTFFHFPGPRGPLVAGPALDYDAALRNDRVAVDPTGWQHRYPRPGRSPWIPELWRRPELAQRIADRYAELRAGMLRTDRATEAIDALGRSCGDALPRNFIRWPVLDALLLTNPDAAGSHALEVERMKSWLELRLRWMDQQFVRAPVVLPGGAIAVPDGTLEGGGVELVSAGSARRLREPTFGGDPDPDELEVAVAAPPEQEFELQLDGGAPLRKPALPIREPLRSLESEVDERGRLHLLFRLPVTSAGPHTLRIRPQVDAEVYAIRFPRYRLAGRGPRELRARRGDLLSPPVRVP